VYRGRDDARQDLATLLAALAELSNGDRPSNLDAALPWPPRVVLVGASPDDRAGIAKAAARRGVGNVLAYAPALSVDRLAALTAGARAAVVPVRSEATGLAAIEAIAAGTPVVASAVGPLPEVVGAAGLLVEPGDPGRLASALMAAWVDAPVRDRIVEATRLRSATDRRTWADVAAQTRAVYAAVGAAGVHRLPT
jgi:glycosyltransferase involved in cell wall biosynthesis